VDPEPTLFDPELDTPRRRPQAVPVESIPACQRLVVNPFLAILGWLAAVAMIRHSMLSHNLALHLTALLWLFVPFLLIQFHCLDCRSTGWYVRAGRHICGGVFSRWVRGEGAQSRWPRLRTQLVVWLYLLAAVALFYFIRLRTPH
jgi:hypothetical protein